MPSLRNDTEMVSGNWERRWHALLQQWVIIAASSATRPWFGALPESAPVNVPEHDSNCYLCPGVTRAAGTSNPEYRAPMAFDNDFPSLSFDAPEPLGNDSLILRREPADGICRVLCWSEKHNTTLAELEPSQMLAVAKLWQSEFTSLASTAEIEQVLMFENKGVEVGVSNLHPHGQVYATTFITDNAQRMRTAQTNYQQLNPGAHLLHDLLAQSSPEQTGLLVERSSHFSVVVPFAARFAYETWIIPHRHVPDISAIGEAELEDLALTYQRQAQRYDQLFARSAPNITLFHNAPCDEHADNAHWCFYIAMQPPLRDPEKLKYLAGFDIGSNNFINPLQPELAAEHLRACNPVAANHPEQTL